MDQYYTYRVSHSENPVSEVWYQYQMLAEVKKKD